MNREGLFVKIDAELRRQARVAAVESKVTLWKFVELALKEKLEREPHAG